jgi:serine/threonine-protein kinase RsbW
MNLRATEAGRSGMVAPSNVIRLPHTPAAVGVTRRRICAELESAGLTRPLLDDIEVVTSELLGNAVLHARAIGGGVLLAGWRIEEGQVMVRVTDGGSLHRVQQLDGAPLSESGRGLRIVDRLARDWGVVDHAAGLRTVWASFPIGPRVRGLRLVR